MSAVPKRLLNLITHSRVNAVQVLKNLIHGDAVGTALVCINYQQPGQHMLVSKMRYHWFCI